MREKKRVEYLYLEENNNRAGQRYFGKRTACQWKEIAGIGCLQMAINGEMDVDRIKKRVHRELKGYRVENCVLGADFAVAEKLQIVETLFFARKRELLENGKRIFRWLRACGRQGGRASLLVVLNSDNWNRRELLTLLGMAKNEYEDLYIVSDKEIAGFLQIAEALYDEWGVVVHLLSGEEAEEMQADTVIFLLKNWEAETARRYTFQNAYVLAESEEKLVRETAEILEMQEKNVKGDLVDGKWENGRKETQKIYSGFAYKKEGTELPYAMAVNMAYQNPQLYQEFKVSFIAIYRLKWYNKK
ncbi:MAG: hypothetical protein NC300_06160 [Bacteroidales bacterium]|nr:hypothetical protein [Clostridium sp.]MCM1203708.1 hypothetical protein [Bacteroidales bacterium]